MYYNDEITIVVDMKMKYILHIQTTHYLHKNNEHNNK